MNEKLASMMSNQMHFLVQDLSGDTALTNMTEVKATDLFLKTPLGAVAEELGINPTLVAQLVGSDPTEAIESFSSRLGYHPKVIHGIIAVIKRDLPKTQ